MDNSLIQDALEDNYVSFENKIRDELVTRVADRIEQEKALIASGMMGEEDEQLDEISMKAGQDYAKASNRDFFARQKDVKKSTPETKERKMRNRAKGIAMHLSKAGLDDMTSYRAKMPHSKNTVNKTKPVRTFNDS